jgi:protein-disulfide isomerase
MNKINHYTKLFSQYFKNTRLTTPVAIILGSLIIASSHIAYGFIVMPRGAVTPVTLFSGKTIDTEDHVEGDRNSDVVVVEYSDPECPYCTQLHTIMKQLRSEYENRISFVYRNFPLTQIHSHAYDESRAITCAGLVGGDKKYYEYIDALFGYKVSHNTTQLPPTGKADIASSIGLDSTAFATCMNNAAAGEKVNTSTEDGIRAGVTGTPSTFILLKKGDSYEVVSMIDGARSVSYFKAAIEEALSR